MSDLEYPRDRCRRWAAARPSCSERWVRTCSSDSPAADAGGKIERPAPSSRIRVVGCVPSARAPVPGSVDPFHLKQETHLQKWIVLSTQSQRLHVLVDVARTSGSQGDDRVGRRGVVVVLDHHPSRRVIRAAAQARGCVAEAIVAGRRGAAGQRRARRRLRGVVSSSSPAVRARHPNCCCFNRCEQRYISNKPRCTFGKSRVRGGARRASVKFTSEQKYTYTPTRKHPQHIATERCIRVSTRLSFSLFLSLTFTHSLCSTTRTMSSLKKERGGKRRRKSIRDNGSGSDFFPRDGGRDKEELAQLYKIITAARLVIALIFFSRYAVAIAQSSEEAQTQDAPKLFKQHLPRTRISFVFRHTVCTYLCSQRDAPRLDGS
ncbi:unnamed protein product [Trichogramma brassicae]|uniref:Uncharacterized protein n=1 Tax=Trichogramma brassicae TaxID=86971 RepID=A0A6H5IT84_9HYME|nr:unnamed protein product [Trichogramma brassicae]